MTRRNALIGGRIDQDSDAGCPERIKCGRRTMRVARRINQALAGGFRTQSIRVRQGETGIRGIDQAKMATARPALHGLEAAEHRLPDGSAAEEGEACDPALPGCGRRGVERRNRRRAR